MKKTCLNCKYEPDWGVAIGKEYPRRSGACKWKKTIKLPSCYICYDSHIIRHEDDSGIYTNCPAWKPKK